MSSEYPDVLGDLVDARQRFEVNGVHYMIALTPTTIAPGEAANLRIWLQSCWNVPVEVVVSIHLPTQAPSAFSILQKQTDVPLEAAEVGEVTIPIACASETTAREYPIVVMLGVRLKTHGLFIRSGESEGSLGETLLSFTTGMALAAVVGLGFVAHTQPKQQFSLRVQGLPQPGPSPNLTPTYLSHWTVSDLPIQGKARQHVNDQRIHLLPKLTRQALYLAFLEESQERLRDASLPVHIGEAIFLAKILTHTVESFLRYPAGQDAVLIPAYTLAFRYDLATNDPIHLLVRADYARLARLAISLSFGLLRQRLRRDVWTLEEQLAVADLVADRVERGGILPAEFLYLPLLLGGVMITDQAQMPGEDLQESLDLLTKARQQRAAELAEIPELAVLLDQLEKVARSTA